MSRKTPFPAAFSEALRSAAAAHTGTAWESRIAPASPDIDPARMSTALAVALRFRGELEGELFLCPDEQASRHTFPAADPSQPQNFPSAWLDLCESSADGIAQTLAAQFGDMQLEDCRVARLAPNVTSLADLMLHAGDVAQGTIALLGDPALRASLEKKGIEAHPASGQLSLHGAAASSQGPPLQRVIDVPLAVTLRFGQRQLTLRELLELNTGSLVELDRQVEEPVDLVLGERVIARGEVVIVDGNYGMRVTEVVENPVRRLSALA